MNSSIAFRFLVLSTCLFFAACNRPSAEKAFDVAVLNSNMYVGFANAGMERELDSPSMKMGKTKDEFVSLQRSEVVQSKLRFVEENYEKLKSFSQTDDTKDIIRKSLALHELILPVYKNEYMQLAKLYDSKASRSEIEKSKQAISDKYFPKFETLYNQLISDGKVFAKEHGIEVKWGM